MTDFPEYSHDAKYVKDLFLHDSVFAIFYFEDSRHEAVYERLLNKLIPGLRSFAVVCLGGKSQLLTKAREKRSLQSLSIFVADKDFDDILNLMENIDSLFYLKCHCLENYFLQPNALRCICIEEAPTRLTFDLATRLTDDFDRFFHLLLKRYTQATRYFLVERKFSVGLTTTKMPLDELLAGADEQFPVPEEEWIISYRNRLQQACHGNNEWLTDDTALDCQLETAFQPLKKGGATTNHVENHLNGKHLFLCLMRYMKARLSVNIESIDPLGLYLRLLTHLDLKLLQPVADEILGKYPELMRSAQ